MSTVYERLSRMFKKVRPTRPHDARTIRGTGEYVEWVE